MVVLAVGLGGLSTLLIASLYTNHRSSQDTTSTMVAEHVLEQISAQPANSATALSVTDCAGTAWSISTQGHAVGTGSGGSYGGDGANLTSGGVVDWTQAYCQCARRLCDAVCRLREWWKPDGVRRALEHDYHEQLRSHGHYFSASFRISSQRRAQVCDAGKSANHWRTLSMRNSWFACHVRILARMAFL